MSLRCRIGWHLWRWCYRYTAKAAASRYMGGNTYGNVCERCGKRQNNYYHSFTDWSPDHSPWWYDDRSDPPTQRLIDLKESN